MEEIILEYRNISKGFYGIPVLKNINFKLEKGKTLGLVGENGAGKSTLMNILGGVFPFDDGEVLLNSLLFKPKNPKDATKSGIAFIHQELNLFTNLTISENIFITNFPTSSFGRIPLISKKEIFKKTKELLKILDLNVSPDMVVEKLSQGERQLVEIAKALSANAKIIIFDEPTTSLTTRETEKLFGIMENLKKSGISMIYISHILKDIFRMCDDIVILRDGEVVGTGRAESLSMDELVTLMVGRKMEQLFPVRKHQIGDEVFLVEDLTQEGIIENINFSLKAGEIVGISGLMGSGRTELARILFGLDPYQKGLIKIKSESIKNLSPKKCIEKGIAFLTENRKEEGLLMDKSITENLGLVSLESFAYGPLKIISKSKMFKDMKGISDALKISTVNVEKQSVQNLSGGNQQKVVIGKWVYNQPTLFILDEPTRGIDVGAKYEVYQQINQLAENGTAVLIISSEIEELLGMCDRILVMNNGEIKSEFTKEKFNREDILKCALGGDLHEIA
jgi:ribose transport system ATP-binding protein